MARGDRGIRRRNAAFPLRWLHSVGLTVAASIALVLTFFSPGHAVGQTDLACGDMFRFTSTDGPKSIPDSGTVTSTLVVPTAGFIQDVDVGVELSHPFDSDLRVELVSPTGPSVTLADTVGLWGDDFTATKFDDEGDNHIISALPPFTGRFVPNDPLSVFDRTDQAGSWTLRVSDQRGVYAGMLKSWSLDITTCEDITAPTGEAIRGAAFSDPFQTKRTFDVRWAVGSDDETGVASRDVNYWSARYDEGFGTGVEWQRAPTSLSGGFRGSPGRTYCFAERLRDGAGNVSSFSPLRCTSLPVDDNVLAHSKGWSEKSGAGYYLSDYSVSRTKGAKLTLPVVGKGFALVATTCPGCGSVDVFLGSTRLKRVSLASDALRKRRIIAIENFEGVRSGKLKVVVTSQGKKVIVEGLGVGRPPIQQLPLIEENAGASPFPGLPQTVPTGAEESSGTLITVTTSSDATNGAVSTVAGLQASPGPDGISLREAIAATNNDPGEYRINFAPALAGSTIQIGSEGEPELPELMGGGVFINGDTDADGEPDISLLNAGAGRFGFKISSSGNRLHALALQNFPIGVNLRSSAADPLANNAVTGTLLMGIEQVGISGSGGSNVRLIGNSIEPKLGGIELLQAGANESAQQVTVAGNSIRNDHPSDFGGGAINLGPGIGVGSDNNRLSDALVAYNSIEGSTGGITFFSGQVGAQFNVMEKVRVFGNRVHVAPARNSQGALRVAIIVAAGDAASDYLCPECPLVYPEDNLVRDVEISGNSLDEGQGVAVAAGVCCGAARNAIQDVRIEHNVIRGAGPSPGVGMNAGGAPGGPAVKRLSSDNEISGVSLERNTITIASTGQEAGGAYGGVYLLGGNASEGGAFRDVHIKNNWIDTEMIGIHLLGGLAFSDVTASDNSVLAVELLGNIVLRTPVPGAFVDPQAKGITLTGGLGKATGNSVTCVTLANNLVMGVVNDVAVLPNVGTGASGNSVSLGGC